VIIVGSEKINTILWPEKKSFVNANNDDSFDEKSIESSIALPIKKRHNKLSALRVP
jgi:hypothetical protein